MVLERGFTQVIIGTVVAVAGVMMLALSWVLVELRRLKKTLSNAAMAMSVASMVGGPAPEFAAPIPRVSSEPEDAAGAPRPGLAVPGAGALAGAGAALAASQVLASTASEKPEEKTAEFDLSSAQLVDTTGSVPDLARDARGEAREAYVDELPAFDPFRPVDPQGEPEPEPEPAVEAAAEPEPEADLPSIATAEPEATSISAASERQEATHAAAPVDEPPEAFAAPHGPSDIEDPLTPEAAPAASRVADEFGMLRESLAGLGLVPEPNGGRIEPSFADVYQLGENADEEGGRRADDLAAAASWMEPLQRRAPWFENPAPAAQEPVAPSTPAEPANVPEMSWPKLDTPEPEAPKQDVPDLDLPQWPPHARDAAPFEPASPLSQEQGWDDAVGEQMAPVDAPSPVSEDETASGPEVEPVAPEAAAAEGGAAPAASDEGIVGAYQVGEAHFTIYADGSIQARTPDGDYSFASMDELKVYLASEKSRLGV
jgi:hypothetical protein